VRSGDIIPELRTDRFTLESLPVRTSTNSITQLLIEWREGDETALDRLIPLVYDEMRRMAHQYMRRERADNTLQTTALINEAYLRLVDHKGMRWQNRSHFYAVAAQAMRRILVDRARTRKAAKRSAVLVNLDEAVPVVEKRPTDLMGLDEALNELEAIDSRKSQVVVMKYFGGMKDKEIADALKISTATVTREWSSAKLWLLKAMSPTSPNEKCHR
jgi:RNA polymerase sigma-70 factor, ECF subfamily